MREITSTLSSKGQVTIPVEVRRYLGIKEGDKLSFVIEDGGTVRIETPRYRNIAALKGAAGSLEKPLSWEETLNIGREDHLANKGLTSAE